MKPKPGIDVSGALMLIAFSALIAFNQLLVKQVNAGMAPLFQAGMRSAFAIIPVAAYALWVGKKLSLKDGSFWPGILAGLFFTGEFTMLFLGLDFTTVARASLFFYTMPFWVALGAHFLIPGDQLTRTKVAGLLLAISGVVIALLIGDNASGPAAYLGDLMCLLGAMCWAGLTLVARASRLKRSAPEMQLLYQLAVSAAILIPLAAATGDTWRDMTPFLGSLFAFQVLIVVSFGFVVWFWLLTIYPASEVASFGFLAPVFGLFFAWAILGEKFGVNLILALALICIGIVLVTRRVSKRPWAKGVAEQV